MQRQPLRSMRVYKREIGMFLILFVFGVLLLAGGWVQAYFGGTWQLTSPTQAGASGGAAVNSLAILTSYAQCAGALASSQILILLFGPLGRNASCSLYSLAPSGLPFVGMGVLSMLVGVVAFRKRFSSVGERISAFWWVLALMVPLIGGIVGYLGVRDKNRTTAINMVLLGIETFLGSALLFVLTGFPFTAI
ncbi:MAG TPA: hypothetical protein VLY65_02160 [Nitrososphaerales archaeon]|nr:hypothetical protein [Nitrososphaerales archaeon]